MVECSIHGIQLLLCTPRQESAVNFSFPSLSCFFLLLLLLSFFLHVTLHLSDQRENADDKDRNEMKDDDDDEGGGGFDV